ncbi:MAG: hypothetical protein GY810_23130 [Aureispira sp.]|nr:hypothetical protein [Aureispira sp.]
MKYIVSCVLILIFAQVGQSQMSTRKNAMTYKFVLIDYNTLDPTYRTANPKRIFHPSDVNYAFELGYFRYINNSFNIAAPLRIGSIDAHHNLVAVDDSTCAPCQRRFYPKEFFVGLDAMGIYKFNNGYILKEDFWIAPYITLGIGAKYMAKRKGHFDFQIPIGLGVNIKLTEGFYIQAQLEYRKSVVINKDNLGISAGLLWVIGKKEATLDN